MLDKFQRFYSLFCSDCIGYDFKQSAVVCGCMGSLRESHNVQLKLQRTTKIENTLINSHFNF